ncbi:hypothetical protein VB773_05155 [Haloarculaceae archaeon H-GB2-1]|nr:hypothetical protein [Haloarculaceae archaeon H-GB1-1]MEA5388966.1 hypothetical protein [Haloarculaceae archaeon H-GB11]MEA5407024.1 hypothetical protein [Haloarculaceae archaeon H-GB2-1]
MEPWGWIIVYVVGFTLFQLLVFRYISGGPSPDNGSADSPLAAEMPALERDRHTRDGHAEDGRYCQHCGAQNESDPMFTYCRECANPL